MEEATNRLMTSVSHDLRTPLTALLGYLEILEGDPRPASESPYLGKCRQRALQIRGMLNDLFEYFFVSTSDKTQADFSALHSGTGIWQAVGGIRRPAASG